MRTYVLTLFQTPSPGRPSRIPLCESDRPSDAFIALSAYLDQWGLEAVPAGAWPDGGEAWALSNDAIAIITPYRNRQ